MALVKRTIVSDTDWAALVKKYGNGGTPPLGDYSTITTDKYPSHDIAQGKNTLGGGGLAQTGYLRLGGTSVIGSVSGLPQTPP